MEYFIMSAGTQTSEYLFERCALAAEKILDVEGFKNWTREFVRPFLPHGALACGFGRINSAGVSMDYVVTVDYPTEHLAAICNSAGGIDTPLMRRWLATRKPVFFDESVSSEGVDCIWLENFRRHGLRNAAADAVFDEGSCVGSYFSFHVLPAIDQKILKRKFLMLTPLLHLTLARVMAKLQLHSTKLSSTFSKLTEREREIATWVEKGKSNADIALLIGLSENTVKHHLTRVLTKTGCSNRAGLAVIVARQAGSSVGIGTKVL